MKFIDLALARRVELAEANAAVSCAEAFQRQHPGCGVAVEKIGGGFAAFAGADSPVTQAIGVGLDGEVSDADLDRLTAFFIERGAPAAVEICPFVDMKLYERLAARGYKLLEVSNVLVADFADLNARLDAYKQPEGIELRVARPGELKLWTRTVCQGFAEHYPVTPEMLDVMEGFALREGSACFFAFIGGEPAGGGAVFGFGGVGGLFGASTLPAYRGRGVQTALLHARLDWARAEGCDLAASITQPGSISHRNIERFGFRVAYTRTKLFRALDAPAPK